MVLYLISLISIKETAIVAWAGSICVHLLTILWFLWGAMLFDYFTLHVDRERKEPYAVTFSKIEKWSDNEKLEFITYSKDGRCIEGVEKGTEE